MLLLSLLPVASTKLTVLGIGESVPAGAGVTFTALTCTPTRLVTAPLNVDSEFTVRLLLLLVPMTALLMAAKVLVPATVTEAPASLGLKTVVAAETVRERPPPKRPRATFPLAVSVPVIVMLELAVTEAANVLAALTVSVCALVKPIAELPWTAKAPVTVAAVAVSPALKSAAA